MSTRKPKPKPSRKPKAAPPVATAPTPPAKAKPTGVLYEPSDKDRRTVDSMGTWAQQREIAKVLGISEMTLRKHFRDQLDTAFLRAQDGMWRSLFRQGMGTPGRKADKARGIPATPPTPPNVQATIKWLEFRAGASARVTVIDGGTEVDPTTLSDVELEARRRKLAAHPAVAREIKRETVH